MSLCACYVYNYVLHVTNRSKHVCASYNHGHACSSAVTKLESNTAACPALLDSASCSCTNVISVKNVAAHFPMQLCDGRRVVQPFVLFGDSKQMFTLATTIMAFSQYNCIVTATVWRKPTQPHARTRYKREEVGCVRPRISGVFH